jgi:hypothetical protein
VDLSSAITLTPSAAHKEEDPPDFLELLKMRVKALQHMYYDKKDRAVGEEYDMDDREYSEANILSALGKIEILKSTAIPKETVAVTPRTYQTAAMKSEEPEKALAQPMTTESSESLVPQRRQYRRRDLKAEE